MEARRRRAVHAREVHTNDGGAAVNAVEQERWERRQCLHCGVSVLAKNAHAKYCSDKCKVAAHRADVAERSHKSMAELIAENDRAAVMRRIRSRVRQSDSGCWEWKGQLEDGYPVMVVAGKRIRIHRLVLEMKHGARLGRQAAHHMCANTMCVNPQHLQPVTHRENVAEMLARRAYESRIAELESALRLIDPSNEILNQISYGVTPG